MKILLTLLVSIASLCAGVEMHSTHQALFRFKIADGHLGLNVKLDRHEIEHYQKHGHSFSAMQTSRHILDHMECKVNGITQEFDFQRSESGVADSYLMFLTPEPVEEVREVDLSLDAFLYVADDFSNVVEFDLNGQFLSYTMNKDRKNISVRF